MESSIASKSKIPAAAAAALTIPGKGPTDSRTILSKFSESVSERVAGETEEAAAVALLVSLTEPVAACVVVELDEVDAPVLEEEDPNKTPKDP